MATSPRPYKNQATKNAKSQNLFIKPKDMVRSTKIEGERREKMINWITFFRRNPHRFVETYFGIKLFPFQVLMLWVLQRSNLSIIVASRGASKSWIIGLWSLVLAVLYPGIKVIVASKTIKQGGIIIEKIEEFSNGYPNVAREIDHITRNSNAYEVVFHNGSSIKVVPSSESARGETIRLPQFMVT